MMFSQTSDSALPPSAYFVEKNSADSSWEKNPGRSKGFPGSRIAAGWKCSAFLAGSQMGRVGRAGWSVAPTVLDLQQQVVANFGWKLGEYWKCYQGMRRQGHCYSSAHCYIGCCCCPCPPSMGEGCHSGCCPVPPSPRSSPPTAPHWSSGGQQGMWSFHTDCLSGSCLVHRSYGPWVPLPVGHCRVHPHPADFEDLLHATVEASKPCNEGPGRCTLYNTKDLRSIFPTRSHQLENLVFIFSVYEPL